MKWEAGEISRVELRSKYGRPCRILPGDSFRVERDGRKVRVHTHADGSLAFNTEAGAVYTLVR